MTTKKKAKKKTSKKATKKVTKNPPHRPKGSYEIKIEEKDYNTVSTLSGFGFSQDDMAVALGMSRATFVRRLSEDTRLREAVLKGKIHANNAVAGVAYKMATSGKSARMTQYWLSCQAGWSQTSKLEVTGAEGMPLNPDTEFAAKINKMTPEELAAFIAEKEQKKSS